MISKQYIAGAGRRLFVVLMLVAVAFFFSPGAVLAGWEDTTEDVELISLIEAVGKALEELPGEAVFAELNEEQHDYRIGVIYQDHVYELVVHSVSGEVLDKSLIDSYFSEEGVEVESFEGDRFLPFHE